MEWGRNMLARGAYYKDTLLASMKLSSNNDIPLKMKIHEIH